MNDPEDTSVAEDPNDAREQAEADLREMLEASTSLSQAANEIVINTDIG